MVVFKLVEMNPWGRSIHFVVEHCNFPFYLWNRHVPDSILFESATVVIFVHSRCNVGMLSSFYFGIPLGVYYKSMLVWDRKKTGFGRCFPYGRDGLFPKGLDSLYFIML